MCSGTLYQRLRFSEQHNDVIRDYNPYLSLSITRWWTDEGSRMRAAAGSLQVAVFEKSQRGYQEPEGAVSTSRGQHSGFVIDTVAAAITQLLLRLRALITLPLIVRLLGTAEYGIWAQVLAFVGLASTIVGLNLHIPLIRFVSAERARSQEIYGTLLSATVLLTVPTAAIVSVFAGPIGGSLLKGEPLREYIQVSSLLIVFANIRLLNLNAYRATGRIILRSVMDLIHALGETIGIVGILVATQSLFDVFVFMAVWEGAFVLLQTPHVISVMGWTLPRRAVLWDAVRYALPLFPAGLSIWMLDPVDRFFIGHMLGATAVGIYSA